MNVRVSLTIMVFSLLFVSGITHGFLRSEAKIDESLNLTCVTNTKVSAIKWLKNGEDIEELDPYHVSVS